MSDFFDELEKYRSAIEEGLVKFMPESDPESAVLREAMLYSLMAGGKRIRPALLLASCEICGGDLNKAMPYACAVEYIHTSSLIHDDHPSMDNDDLRRGKPTNHIVYGDGMAILAGDGLLNLSYDAMLKDIVSDRTDDNALLLRKIRAMREISDAVGAVMSGQTVDLEAEKPGTSKTGTDNTQKQPFKVEDLLTYMHMHKTGSLIRAAVRTGVILAGGDDETLSSLTVYAENVGMAFQIVDDILDVTGSSESLGKNSGADEKLGKLTFPSVYGLERSYEKAENATEAALNALECFGEKARFLRLLALELLRRAA